MNGLANALVLAGLCLGASAEARSFDEIVQSKVLRIATRNRTGITVKDAKGNLGGFNYCLADEFARQHGLKIEVNWQPFSFQHYFFRDGKFPEDVVADPNVVYRPDVFKDSDLAVDGFLALPWRRKLADFAPTVLARTVVIFNKSRIAKATRPEDLEGKTVLVKPSTVQHELVLELAKKVRLNVKLIEQSPSETEGDDLQPLKDGRADFMVYPALYSMTDVKADANLGFGFPVGDAESSDWMLEKGNATLQRALITFIADAEKSGAYDRCFTQEYRVTYNQYLRSVDVVNGD